MRSFRIAAWILLPLALVACGSDDDDAPGGTSGAGGTSGGGTSGGGTSGGGTSGGGKSGAGGASAGAAGVAGHGGTPGGGSSGGPTTGGASGSVNPAGAGGTTAGSSGAGGSTAGASGTGAAGSTAGAAGSTAGSVDAFGSTWRPLRIGAGGWLTGLDIAPDGTKVVRADTYGAYVWSGDRWQQLITTASMPAADTGVDRGGGVYEIKIAPGNSQRLYMMFRGMVYRSDNRGGTWAKTAFTPVPGCDANGETRTTGQKMAVDPANPDVVYVGTTDSGLWVTTSGGSSWSEVSAVPHGTPGKAGNTGIAFDPASGTTAGKTNTLYAGTWDGGVYVSTDAGATWNHPPGGPTSVGHGKVAPTGGAYFATSGDGAKVWRYQAGAWKDVTPENNTWNTVLVDPHDAKRVVAIRDGGFLDISHDGGDTWGGILFGSGANTRVATDIPWLAWTAESYMSVGDMEFDPTAADRVFFSEGIGVWHTDLVGSPSSITFTSQSLGIEQLVANEIVSPPGGKPLVGSWDRPVFTVNDPDAFPATHGPSNQNAIVMGWSLDWASSAPSFVAGVMNWFGVDRSGYSADGGATWKPFATLPAAATAGKIGGSIAVSSPTSIVWAPSNNARPSYTQDGGVTWKDAVFPDAPAGDESGWGFGYYLDRQIVAADRVTTGTFYAYNYLKGVYRSADGGVTWALASPGEIDPFSGYNARLRTVPGKAGHLFFTTGQQGGAGDPNPAGFAHLMHSTDGGSTWQPTANVAEVYDVGFGKEATAGGYPAIYIVGWVNGVYGIHRSNDEAKTWKQVGDFPLASLDTVKAISGDMNKVGRVYIGFGGSGYAYGDTAP